MHKVYLVDDDIFVRKGIKTLIDWESYGFKVCGEAGNGEDALSEIKELQPDLVLTDIRMPVLDGLDLIKHSKETLSRSPYFIVISGYNDFKYAQRALRYGVKDFILKPVDQEEIHQTLRKISGAIEDEYETKQMKDKMETVSEIKKLLLCDKECNLSTEWDHPFLDGKHYTFIKIEINGLNMDYQLNFEKLENALLEMDGQNHFMCFEDNINCFGLVINDKFLTANHKTIDQFLEEWYRQAALDMHVYCGETVHKIKELTTSYKTAKKCVQFKYLFDEPIITASLIDEKDVFFIDLDQSYYDKMMEFIEENNHEYIEKQLNNMIQTCKEMNFAKDALRTMVNRLNHKILKSIKESEGNEQKITNLKDMLEWDQYSLSLRQVEELWGGFMKDAANILAKLNQNNVKGTIYQIKKYIHSHYDQSITLKSIANKFYMNPVYMGQLFKKTYGVYFKDYILKVRMDEAKKLLRTTDLKVYEVAENVGFNNPDYFVTQFEKIVKTTPSQYRKKLMNRIS
ncbi:two component transcriptional regulator, AraC family [Gracilibacillus orientalis]|uniref:Two component transcriptional regulator, AraC family n=1 Tax=Gracilibacillus orientalis TaxID=334253 RepID=A0A1I4IET1_9BACI|nr:response regulator [Gracilibacillus orientalis]SFL52291.1 two component transcriptional regulator, AraC family [Gracilibacillus orientalis]